MDVPNEYGLDVSCNLGSLDIHKATKSQNFEELVDTSMQLLTNVSEMTYIKNVPSVAKANELMHSVGLGVMNLHGHLVQSNLLYGSDESIQFIDYFMEALNFYSLKASMEIAKKKNKTFYGFEHSEYANGHYFDQYVNKMDVEPSEKVKQALGNVPVITAGMWKELKAQVQEHGVYNAYRLAVAPTGSISYIRSCTASMAPITEKVEIRDYADSRTIYPMPYMTNENKHLYVEAYDIEPYKLIDMYVAAQKHVDQGISMTLYVTDRWTTAQLAKVYIYAWMRGIKTVYYVRQRLQTLEECVSCSI